MFKEWIDYFLNSLKYIACLLFTGIGWIPAIMIECVFGPDVDPYAITIIASIILLFAIPTLILIKKHNNSILKVSIIIIISFTAGIVVGSGSTDTISNGISMFLTSVVSGGYDGGYDDGYDDGIAKGKEVAKEHYYDSGYEDGYIDGQNLSMGDNYNGVSYVYVTATGSKYHKLGCQYLSSSCYKISYQEATYDGYEPCSRCY